MRPRRFCYTRFRVQCREWQTGKAQIEFPRLGLNMADFHPKCPKCNVVMERGHIPDTSQGGAVESSWAPGEAEARRFVGGIKYQQDELIPLIAYRCSPCGYVELYALPS